MHSLKQLQFIVVCGLSLSFAELMVWLTDFPIKKKFVLRVSSYNKTKQKPPCRVKENFDLYFLH